MHFSRASQGARSACQVDTGGFDSRRPLELAGLAQGEQAVFQAAEPGSIPGIRSLCLCSSKAEQRSRKPQGSVRFRAEAPFSRSSKVERPAVNRWGLVRFQAGELRCARGPLVGTPARHAGTGRVRFPPRARMAHESAGVDGCLSHIKGGFDPRVGHLTVALQIRSLAESGSSPPAPTVPPPGMGTPHYECGRLRLDSSRNHHRTQRAGRAARLQIGAERVRFPRVLPLHRARDEPSCFISGSGARFESARCDYAGRHSSAADEV